MVERHDPGLEILLDLDGAAFGVDSSGEYLVKFVVQASAIKSGTTSWPEL
jgi:hypothetical protein